MDGDFVALRNIRTDDDEILRKNSREVKEINEKIITLLNDMIETMNENNGCGLAAPQVGVLKRIAIVDVGDGIVELINPYIIKESGEQKEVEGCLSLPGIFGEVKRPKKVKVEALNRDGEKVTIKADDMFARAICHEVDHLNGILFKDKVIKYIDCKGQDKKEGEL
jgi:peptide deformylase